MAEKNEDDYHPPAGRGRVASIQAKLAASTMLDESQQNPYAHRGGYSYHFSPDGSKENSPTKERPAPETKPSTVIKTVFKTTEQNTSSSSSGHPHPPTSTPPPPKVTTSNPPSTSKRMNTASASAAAPPSSSSRNNNGTSSGLKPPTASSSKRRTSRGNKSPRGSISTDVGELQSEVKKLREDRKVFAAMARQDLELALGDLKAAKERIVLLEEEVKNLNDLLEIASKKEKEHNTMVEGEFKTGLTTLKASMSALTAENEKLKAENEKLSIRLGQLRSKNLSSVSPRNPNKANALGPPGSLPGTFSAIPVGRNSTTRVLEGTTHIHTRPVGPRPSTVDPQSSPFVSNNVSQQVRKYLDPIIKLVASEDKTVQKSSEQKNADSLLIPALNLDPVYIADYEKPSRVDVLLITYVASEYVASVSRLSPLNSSDPNARVTHVSMNDKVETSYCVGILGSGAVTVVAKITQGVADVESALEEWRPKAVISVGRCYGIDANTQNFGDVLISKAVVPYHIYKGAPRVERTLSSPQSLLAPFSGDAIKDWKFTGEVQSKEGTSTRESRVHIGAFASGPLPVSAPVVPRRLLTRQSSSSTSMKAEAASKTNHSFVTALNAATKSLSSPDIVGGSLDTDYIAEATLSTGTPWLTVRSIISFLGDTTHMNADLEPFACACAIDLVEYVLSSNSAFLSQLPPPPLASIMAFPYTEFLNEKRTDFTGREWLFSAVESWRKVETSSTVLLVAAEEGSGRSAWFAEYVEHPIWSKHVLGFHLCQRDLPESLDGRKFVGSIAKRIILGLVSKGIHVEPELLRDFERVYRNPAHEVIDVISRLLDLLPWELPEAHQADAPFVICIDSLNEALVRPSYTKVDLVKILIDATSKFPDWLKLVATTSIDTSGLAGLEGTTISLNSRDHALADARAFIKERLSHKAVANWFDPNLSHDVITEKLLTLSRANFLHISLLLSKTFLSSLGKRLIDDSALKTLFPDSLPAMYMAMVSRNYTDKAAIAKIRGPLSVLACAPAPVPESVLKRLFGADVIDGLTVHLERYIQIVPAYEDEAHIRIDSKPFEDWLVSSDTPFKVNVDEGHKLLAKYGLRAWKEVSSKAAKNREDGEITFSPYFASYLPYHLVAIGSFVDLHENLLMNMDWVRMKLESVDVDALLDDFQLLLLHANFSPSAMAKASSSHSLVRDSTSAVYRVLTLCRYILVVRPDQLDFQLLQYFVDSKSAPIKSLISKARSEVVPLAARAFDYSLEAIMANPGRVTAVCIMPDSRLVVGLEDYSLRIWNSVNHRAEAVLQDHEGTINGLVAFSTEVCVSVSSDRTVKLWNLNSATCDGTLTTHKKAVRCVVRLPDRKRIATAGDDEAIRIFDVASQQEVAVLKNQSSNTAVTAMVALNDGRLVSAGVDRMLRVWKIESGKAECYLKGHTRKITCLAALPDGSHIVSGSEDRSVCVWNLAKIYDPPLKLLGHTDEVLAVTALTDNLIVSSSFSGSLRIWNRSTGKMVRYLSGHVEQTNQIAAFEGEGLRFASVSNDSTLRLWNALEHTEQKPFVPEGAHTGFVKSLVAVPVSQSAGSIATGSADKTARIWSSSGKLLKTLRGHKYAVTALAALTDGRIATGSGDFTIRLWNLNDPDIKPDKILEGHTNDVRVLLALPDGRVVSGSKDKTIRVWDVHRGRTELLWTGHSHWINDLLALADGRVVSASEDTTLRVWHTINTGGETMILQGHSQGVTCLALLPNGRIVSGSNDKTIRVWNVRRFLGATDTILTGHTWHVTSVNALSDGRLVSTSKDRTLRIWDTTTGATQRVLHWPNSIEFTHFSNNILSVAEKTHYFRVKLDTASDSEM